MIVSYDGPTVDDGYELAQEIAHLLDQAAGHEPGYYGLRDNFVDCALDRLETLLVEYQAHGILNEPQPERALYERMRQWLTDVRGRHMQRHREALSNLSGMLVHVRYNLPAEQIPFQTAEELDLNTLARITQYGREQLTNARDAKIADYALARLEARGPRPYRAD